MGMTVHLHTRSCYTLLESTVRIDALARKSAEMGFSAAAITDRNVMFAVPSFIASCRRYGIKPLVGMECVCFYHEENVPFLLLAKDNIGYQNLIRLSSKISRSKGICTPDEMREAANHCFLIAYGEGGWLDAALVNQDFEEVSSRLQIMKSELPPFDIALSYQEAKLWHDRNAVLKRICSNFNIRTAALNKIYYLEENEAQDLRILSAIRQSAMLNDSRLSLNKGRFLADQQRMAQLYDADDLARTDEIAAQCTGDYVLKKAEMPLYQAKNNVPASEYLPALCAAGLKKRLNDKVPQAYGDRLKYELEIIQKMHFENYFLIVYDFIRYARSQSIYIGPGRGSAAGSLVAWCLGITQIDPLKYDLLFERFLNPERVSMPDIDTDIPDDRRQDVIDYVISKYGGEHVANIITFGTFGARQAIRDIAKVSGIPMRETEMITRLIGSKPGVTLESAYRTNKRLKQVVDASQSAKNLYQTAMRLEGLPRHMSTHAAGIVMTREQIEETVPTVQLNEGIRTVQYTMEHLEERGLIKMDFLGLRNLTIIDEIVRMIQKEDPSFSIMQIRLDDPAVYRTFQNADTAGVFQFESEGMKNLLKRMKPENYEDMTAALALYRPASAESIPNYIAAKADPSSVRYPLKQLEPVLKSTYGVMIFQEQAMLTAEIAAGFSLGRADVLRKAMSKKKDDQIQALRGEFMRGCASRGVNEQTAASLFELVSRFGGYGFNKSHAVAYGLVAYQSAYLKTHYPVYFYLALLNSVIGDEAKTSLYVDECRRKKIRVCSPNVNRSMSEYILDGDAVLLPLSAVREVGYHAASEIIEEREKGGAFTDYFDFIARMLMHKMARSIFEKLIDAGALDCFEMGRNTMKGCLDEAISYGELVQVGSGSQMSIDLGLVSKPVPVRRKDDREEIAENEKNALGFCLGDQPIVLIRQANGIREPSLSAIKDTIGKVYGFAQIRSVHEHRTKYGEMMAFVKLADETGETDAAVMPKLYRRTAALLLRGTYIRFNGRISEEGRMILDDIIAVPKK